MPRKSYAYKGGKRRVSRHMPLSERIKHHTGERFGLPLHGKRCLAWTSDHTPAGYPKLTFRGKTLLVCRVVLERRLGYPLRPGLWALHHCDHRGCIEEKHLYAGTPLQNAEDKVSRHPSNGRGNHKLTPADIEKMWSLKRTHRQCQIAALFGVSDATVSNIFNRKIWRHVR